MRLIDADWVLAHLKPYEPSDEEWSITGGTAIRLIHNAIDNAPTIDPYALQDEANKCVVGDYHEWMLSARGSDEVGNRVDTYQCRKCGETFKVKFEENAI